MIERERVMNDRERERRQLTRDGLSCVSGNIEILFFLSLFGGTGLPPYT